MVVNLNCQMKGEGTSLLPVHAGIKADLDELLARFKERNSVRFRVYAEVARAFQICDFYAGRQNTAELVEFAERVLQTAVSYMVSRTVVGNSNHLAHRYLQSTKAPTIIEPSFTERVFGVYACYSLYHLQPSDFVTQIRITPGQMQELVEFVEERLRPERHLDTIACVYRLIDDGAFKLVAFETCYDPIAHRRYDLPEEEEEAAEEPDPPFSRLRNLLEDPLFQQLESVAARYEEGKKKLGLSIPTRTNVAVHIRKNYYDALAEIDDEEHQIEITNDMNMLTGRNQPPESKSSIKAKAYGSKIKHSRNRRYADPSMEDNFAVSADSSGEENEDNDSDTMAEEPVSQRKKKGRPSAGGRRKSIAKRKADASITDLVDDILEKDDNNATETPKKGRKGNKKKAANADEAGPEGEPSTSKASARKAKTPKKKSAKEHLLETAEGSEPVSTPKRTLPARPTVDAEFEESLKRYAETPRERDRAKTLSRLLND